MKWAVIGLCVLGSVAAACAALLVNALRVQATNPKLLDPNSTQPVEVAVLYARKALPPMTVVESSFVYTKTMRSDQAPAHYESNPVEVVGKVLSKPILADQPFTPACFSTPTDPQQLATVIPAGKRAVGIQVSNYAGLGNFLYKGSMVDVMVSLKQTDSAESGKRDAFTTTLLENISVLAVGDQSVVSPTSSGILPESNPRAGDMLTVTLLVDSKQAKMLQLAMEQGTLSLAMRNPMDSETAIDKDAIELRTLFGKKYVDDSVEKVVMAAPTTKPVEAPKWDTVIMRANNVETRSFPLDTTKPDKQ